MAKDICLTTPYQSENCHCFGLIAISDCIVTPPEEDEAYGLFIAIVVLSILQTGTVLIWSFTQVYRAILVQFRMKRRMPTLTTWSFIAIFVAVLFRFLFWTINPYGIYGDWFGAVAVVLNGKLMALTLPQLTLKKKNVKKKQRLLSH